MTCCLSQSLENRFIKNAIGGLSTNLGLALMKSAVDESGPDHLSNKYFH